MNDFNKIQAELVTTLGFFYRAYLDDSIVNPKIGNGIELSSARYRVVTSKAGRDYIIIKGNVIQVPQKKYLENR